MEMVLESPTKHNRSELHLMRQRGAGTRIVTAQFDFSFHPLGLVNNPTESVTTSRRGLDVDPTVAEASNGKSAAVRPIGPIFKESVLVNSKAVSSVLERKRQFTELSDELRPTGTIDGDGINARTPASPKPSKQTRTKKQKIDDDSTECRNPSTVPSRRPRRIAAKKAIARVCEGYAEEAIPIDSKRQDPVLPPASRSKRKPKPTKSISLDESIKSALSKGRQQHSAERDETLQQLPIQVPEAAQQASLQPLELISKALTVEKRASWSSLDKAQRRPNIWDREQKRESRVSPTRRPLVETDRNSFICMPSPDKKNTVATHAYTKADSTMSSDIVKQSMSTLSKDSAVSRRKKLQVISDVENLAEKWALDTKITHTSGIKTAAMPKARRELGSGKTRQRKPVSTEPNANGEQQSTPPVLRVALNSRSGMATTCDPSKLTAEMSGSGTSRKDIAARSSVHPVDDLASKSTMSVTNDLHVTKDRSKTQKRAKRGLKISSPDALRQSLERGSSSVATRDVEDGDVGLLDLGGQYDSKSRGLRLTHAKAPAPRKQARAVLAKMPSMNLDDLLSNIASLAQKEKK